MIQELKTYVCDHTSKDDDILESMKIVKMIYYEQTWRKRDVFINKLKKIMKV